MDWPPLTVKVSAYGTGCSERRATPDARICVGVFLWMVVPSPNCPELFFPKVWSDPSDLRMREWPPPAAIWATPDARICVGVFLWVVEPSPSCPLSFNPKEWSDPSDLRIREWEVPAAI